MPLYDYDCAACGRRVEVIHGVHAAGPTACPTCGGGPLRKAIAAAAVHFKGSGWAKRDRRSAASSHSTKGSTDATAASDGAAGEGTTKPDGSGSAGDASSGSGDAGQPTTPGAKDTSSTVTKAGTD